MFKSAELFQEISKAGFAVIDANLIEETEQLHSFIRAHFKISHPHFYYSLLENDFEQNKSICQHFKKILHSFYEANFTDYRTVTESFLAKPAHTSDELLLHQDWCYTDEKKYCAYNIWIPLADITEENGAMFFLPGSHLWFDNLRSASLPTARISSKKFSSAQIASVTLKKGQALLFHPAVFHGSTPNLSSKDRIIVTATLLSETAPFIYFHQGDAPDEVKIFHLDDAALLRTLKTVAMRGSPDLPEERTLNYAHHLITEAELVNRSLTKNYDQ